MYKKSLLNFMNGIYIYILKSTLLWILKPEFSTPKGSTYTDCIIV